MSSMYAQCSEQYWKERKKTNTKINIRTLMTSILLFMGMYGIRIRRIRQIKRIQAEEEERIQYRKRQLETLIRPNPTEDHYRTCEIQISHSIKMECNNLCTHERKSIPRPVMHEACIQGCTSSITPSAISGCRQVSEEDVYRKYGNQGYAQCSRFQNVDPRPDVYSTCRKYHREGLKKGRLVGYITMDEILNNEFNELRRQLEVEGN